MPEKVTSMWQETEEARAQKLRNESELRRWHSAQESLANAGTQVQSLVGKIPHAAGS